MNHTGHRNRQHGPSPHRLAKPPRRRPAPTHDHRQGEHLPATAPDTSLPPTPPVMQVHCGQPSSDTGGPLAREAAEGAGGGVHELLGDGTGVDPADLGVLAALTRRSTRGLRRGRSGNRWAPRPPRPVNDVGDLEGLRLHRQAGLLTELTHGGFGDRLAGLALADRKVPHACANLAFSLRWRSTTRFAAWSSTMTAATSSVMDSGAGLRASGWSSVVG